MALEYIDLVDHDIDAQQTFKNDICDHYDADFPKFGENILISCTLF